MAIILESKLTGKDSELDINIDQLSHSGNDDGKDISAFCQNARRYLNERYYPK